jgi:NADH:quinone reductase (non-electrogenic)
MSDPQKTRIVILGGGFGGVYTALALEKSLARDPRVEITLLNRENFFLFTPMLHEIAASDLDITNIVHPIRKLLSRVRFFEGDVEKVDVARKVVVVSHGGDHHHHDLPYDHLVVGLGSITNFFDLPGLAQEALTMKSLGDAISLRNRMIARLEEADTECACDTRERLLTFAVAGGGFAGIETVASMHDFLLEAVRYYQNLTPEMLRVVLIHPGPVVLPELSDKLGRYTQAELARRGVDVRLRTRVSSMKDGVVTLSDGSTLVTDTLVWTAGTSPHPILATLPGPKERGRLAVGEDLAVPGFPGVWALGDSAAVPDAFTGKPCPPTAQHALRQARALARNLEADLKGEARRPFRFRTIGALASLGRRAGVAEILGLRFSGFVAWWLWRTIYLMKLPTVEKKVRVALEWTLDLVFEKDLVKFLTLRAPTVSHDDEEIVMGQAA